MNPILSAFLIVGAIGLICSILLVVASYFFRIEEEEKTKQIRDCLPGVNCGACGFSGCDGYAKALALGECEPSLCIPGSVDVANKLSEILGITVCAEEPKVAFITCNGNCDAAVHKAVYDGITSCRIMSQLFSGPKLCQYGCLGCGDCASACPSNAICMRDGIAHINPKACIGCGMCVNTCPQKSISLYSRNSVVAVRCSSFEKGAAARKSCTNACIGCKKCESVCPEKAITVTNNLASIDYSKCSACLKCHDACPTHCIMLVDFSA